MAAPTGLQPLRKTGKCHCRNGCKILVGHECTRQSVCDDVFGAGDVVKCWVIFFKEKTPVENTLSCITAEFVEGIKVGYPTDSVVFLVNDEVTTYTRRAASR